MLAKLIVNHVALQPQEELRVNLAAAVLGELVASPLYVEVSRSPAFLAFKHEVIRIALLEQSQRTLSTT